MEGPESSLSVTYIMPLISKALEGKEDLGFTLAPRRSRRHPAKTITDLDYEIMLTI